MSIEIILAVVAGVSTVGGSAGAYLLFKSQSAEGRAKADVESMRYRYGQALKEIEACHAEEDLFCQEMESIGAGSANSVKIDFRNRVETMGFTRPSWKPSKIKEELQWLDDAPHRPSLDRPYPAIKPAGPIQHVVAKHLDKFLSSGENMPIRHLPAPSVSDEPAAPHGPEHRAPRPAATPLSPEV